MLWFDSAGAWHQVGTLTPTQPSDATPRYTPVSMVDNGTKIMIVDGSVDGWTANVVTHDGWANIPYTQDAYSGWYGSNFISYQDTFFIANKPNSPIFYVSGSEATTWDALDFASMTGQAGYLLAAISAHRVLWLLGTNSYEIWINNGGDGTAVNSFPFSIYPEAYGNWGCAAVYSIAGIQNQIFWLSQDKFGYALVMHGESLQAKRASTYAIEYQISQYPTVSDAIGYCYQQQGHVFYVLTFPSAHSSRGATWVFDASSNEWHERAYTPRPNGIEYRHLGNAAAAAYGNIYVGDWRNGNLYTFDTTNYTDDGEPIKRLRSFPHQIDLEANRRVMYTQVIAQMQVGTGQQGTQVSDVVACDFVATDGTLLQDYVNTDNVGASFSKVGAVDAVIISDEMTASGAGDVLYEVSGTPDTPDYFVRFNAIPSNYNVVAENGATLFVTARANDAGNGYQAGVSSDGSQYSVYLTVVGGATSTVALGTLDSGYYQVTLNMTSTSITVSVFRSEDDLWVDQSGTWQGGAVNCILIVDNTYTVSGRVLVGGTWE